MPHQLSRAEARRFDLPSKATPRMILPVRINIKRE